MHLGFLQRASASGHHHRTQESQFIRSHKMKTNIHGHCSVSCTGLQAMAIPLSRDQDPEKSGHGCLLCLTDGQGQFLPAHTCSLGFILAWKRRLSGLGRRKKEEASSRRHPNISLFFRGTILLFRPHGCSGADPTSWLCGYFSETSIVPPRMRHCFLVSVRRM